MPPAKPAASMLRDASASGGAPVLTTFVQLSAHDPECCTLYDPVHQQRYSSGTEQQMVTQCCTRIGAAAS